MAVTVADALSALEHSGAHGGYDDIERQERPPFVTAAGASKDGRHVIVKMTPDQVLRFVDMIAEELD